MKNKNRLLIAILSLCVASNAFIACSSDDSSTTEEVVDDEDNAEVDDDELIEDEMGGPPDGEMPGGPGEEEGDIEEDDGETVSELHAAFAEFSSEAVTVYLSDDSTDYIIETTGLPNHDTVYWGEGNDGYIDEPGVGTTPSIMTSNDNSVIMTVDATPNLTGASVSTELNTIGIAVSGSSIFNDQEGNGALDEAAGSLDWTGAHIGPGVYHYHLEPKAFSNDDDELIGILKDGVFIYGRKDYPSNDYPTDLDESGGHFGPTPHNEDGEYHYHIINEIYSTTGSYILFEGPFQGY